MFSWVLLKFLHLPPEQTVFALLCPVCVNNSRSYYKGSWVGSWKKVAIGDIVVTHRCWQWQPQDKLGKILRFLFSFRQTSSSKRSLNGKWVRCLVFCLRLLELEITCQVFGECYNIPMKLHRRKRAAGRYSSPMKRLIIIKSSITYSYCWFHVSVSDCAAKRLVNSCETVPTSMSICSFSVALLHSLDIYYQPEVQARPSDRHSSQSTADCRHLWCSGAAFSSVCI